MAIHTDKVESNWAGNVRYSSNAVCYPQSISELQQLLQNLDEAKAIGTCHSFSTIADTQGFQISARRLQHAIKLDAAASQVTVGAAVRYGELAEFLDTRGYALPAMASLPHISVVGGCATATHGSGNALGNLSTSVESLEIVTGSGELRTLTRAQHGDLFNGVVVHLGALGFVTSITLRVIPRFLVAQTVYSNLDCQELCSHFETITGSAYSVSLFTDWRGSNINQVWVKERVDNATPLPSQDDFYGAARAISPMHPISYLSPDSCTTQLGIPGPWHERLPHFKSSHNPSVGDEIQSEYFVPIELAAEAIRRLLKIQGLFNSLLHISEIRTIAADTLWLSPCYERDSVGIHFTWKPDQQRVLEVLPRIEDTLRELEPRPHWGKVSTLAPSEICSRYRRLDDFRKLAKEFDPQERFVNPFLRQIFSE